MDSGYLMLPSAVPEVPETVPAGEPGAPPAGPEPPPSQVKEGTTVPGTTDEGPKAVHLKFRATKYQVFKAFQAIANLADKSDDGKVTIHVEGSSESGYDPSWLRNAVEEPLDEVNVEKE